MEDTTVFRRTMRYDFNVCQHPPPFYLKTLKRWCDSEAVGVCTEEMLQPSSSNVPPAAALVSSAGLTVSYDVDNEEGCHRE
jgi:hypothetical protein